MTSIPVPAKIRKLDEAVVNRIAAGEVIQRPANCLKELLENSLDAKSKSISVLVNNGGLKLLQITDNGTGIRKEDMGILCERFTTSKLQTFEDLRQISTYGFRGEALASISHVARLSVTTKTADDVCGFKASYNDGQLVGEVVPVAANQGTQITVEDLFHNVPTRQKALKGADEFHRVADVISKYAIHNSGVAFSLKKQGEASLCVKTQRDATVTENIGIIFGHSVSKELIGVEKSDAKLKFDLSGQISNVNFSRKKFDFLLFINHRLVECSSLKKALELVYNAYLPKGSHPFAYLSLQIDPRNVDVNVHPTKHEVQFLYQDEIIESIQKCIDAKLLGSNSSRSFQVQTVLPGAPRMDPPLKVTEISKTKTVADKNLVRVDAKVQKIDKFLTEKPTVMVTRVEETTDDEMLDTSEAHSTSMISNVTSSPPAKTEASSSPLRREIKLMSVKNLRETIQTLAHDGLRELIVNHFFVGCVSPEFALLQAHCKLYLVSVARVSEEIFYQLAIRDFGNFGAIKLEPPPSIRELCLLALNAPDSTWTEADGSMEDVADFVTETLMEKSEMLDDYFSMDINEEGQLLTIPELIKTFVPSWQGLPIFLLRLATEVNWEEEEACFHTFCRELAKFHAIRPEIDARYDQDQHVSAEAKTTWQSVVELIFAEAKRYFFPPKAFANDLTFAQVANLPDLYKVFERC